MLLQEEPTRIGGLQSKESETREGGGGHNSVIDVWSPLIQPVFAWAPQESVDEGRNEEAAVYHRGWRFVGRGAWVHGGCVSHHHPIPPIIPGHSSGGIEERVGGRVAYRLVSKKIQRKKHR